MTQEAQAETPEPQPGGTGSASRRSMLAGVGLLGLAGAVTACSAGSSSSSTPAAGTAPTAAGTTPAAAAPSSAAASSAAASGAPASAAADALTETSAIPVGSGKIFAGPKVVVTQPTAGQYKAFSAICTHLGCTVSQVSNGTIDCPCHGSQYNITTGAVVAGPAPQPLPAKQIKVSGGSIFLE
jgi:Rieske Fe-S protein